MCFSLFLPFFSSEIEGWLDKPYKSVRLLLHPSTSISEKNPNTFSVTKRMSSQIHVAASPPPFWTIKNGTINGYESVRLHHCKTYPNLYVPPLSSSPGQFGK